MKNVAGLFDDHRHAEEAVRDLHDAGFSKSDISFIANNRDSRYEVDRDHHEKDSEAAEGAGFGATGGAVVGGIIALLLAPAALLIPGIGPVLVGGTLASTIGATALGAGVGAAAGALVGALVGAAIPEEHAHAYAEGVRRGGAFVMVTVANDEQADRATDIFNRHDVVDIENRTQEYRGAGWDRFDETAEPDAGTTTSRYGTAETRPVDNDLTRERGYNAGGDTDAGRDRGYNT